VFTPNSFNHASANDDFDDDSPSTPASLVFQNGRDEYDNLVRNMLVAWDAVVGVAVGMWVALRMLYILSLRALRTEAVAAARAEANDEWRDTRRGAWEARRRLLEARREAFNEVARPLEPYIAVFVVFAAPAFVMSTRFCQNHSGANAVIGADDGGVGSLSYTYGTCDVWCEFVLAFRSLASVAVYLASRKRLAELVGVRTTLRKLCTRVVGCISCTPVSYALLDHGDEIEMDEFNDTTVKGTSNADAPSSWQINESNIQKVQLLGRGGFGEVWEALLEPDGRRVAVKFMLAAVVDDDGDIVNPYADEDFRKECDALQRVDSPYLLKFFGFGTTASGSGFIVTEVLSGGSLMDLLHDPNRDVPWHARISIGLQVALGMEHLHKKHMLHRDLKSANVLLDEGFKAKVCDFGLSRVVRPARRHVVVRSSFTGVTKLLPSVDDGIDMNTGQSALLSSLGVSFVDAHGTMTKAAGTLLWMAPEVYRGDQTYTNAVDVYSFGIVLWELATRKAPWVDELSSETVFFEQLNTALQTGRRPAIPDSVLAEHSAFVAVMRHCWAGDPADRPTFTQAAADLFACALQCDTNMRRF
jgi:serine/threonine protein kinase